MARAQQRRTAPRPERRAHQYELEHIAAPHRHQRRHQHRDVLGDRVHRGEARDRRRDEADARQCRGSRHRWAKAPASCGGRPPCRGRPCPMLCSANMRARPMRFGLARERLRARRAAPRSAAALQRRRIVAIAGAQRAGDRMQAVEHGLVADAKRRRAADSACSAACSSSTSAPRSSCVRSPTVFAAVRKATASNVPKLEPEAFAQA